MSNNKSFPCSHCALEFLHLSQLQEHQSKSHNIPISRRASDAGLRKAHAKNMVAGPPNPEIPHTIDFPGLPPLPPLGMQPPHFDIPTTLVNTIATQFKPEEQNELNELLRQGFPQMNSKYYFLTVKFSCNEGVLTWVYFLQPYHRSQ